MAYAVKEMYYTIQGEGMQTGLAAVFCRFAGCNLWSGHEKDRHSAICQFCDTDFVGVDGENGGKFKAAVELAIEIDNLFPKNAPKGSKWVVCTGGEPLLQLDKKLINVLHSRDIKIAVETNGTQFPPEGIDWICVSPKAGAPLKLTFGNELKLVFPQPLAMPQKFESLRFDYFFIQPMDGENIADNTEKAIEFCKANPKWRLSLQTHKFINIP